MSRGDEDVVRRPWTQLESGPPDLSPRELAVIARVGELIRSRPRSVRDVFCVDERDWVYPKYARLIIQEQTAFQFGVGPYLGLNDMDRRRRFWRVMEDFCDKSDAIADLPPWRSLEATIVKQRNSAAAATKILDVTDIAMER